ncbi:uncharacterized protein EI90DRAFT_2907581, partial [Cantharellus anzutake]|uniref:uncharacterized protein n=1 Tax=Cantharellus anzutake TaxID=1750568 RepID=UPI001908BC6E
QVATIRHLAHHTSVPVPKIICFNSDNGDENDLFIATEKVQGVNLQSVYHEIPSLQKEAIVTKVARWILELYHLRFDKIGSLHLLPEDPSSAAVGPISTDVWNINGRARIEGIDRGPWPTAKDYFKACSQRELDCLKPFLTQEGSEEYKRTVEESRIQVEYSMELMDRIIDNCEGLDEDDPYFAPFAVNARAFELENIFVSEDDFSKIVLIEGWRNTTIRPLWHCAHLPSWLTISLYESDDTSDKKALENTFRKTVSSLDRSFLLGLDAGGTRQSLEEVCNYDALKYGYIVTPTLQSISMTLPKKLDIEGIREVLDPHTDVGRVARTMSVTQGSAWESMSMNIQFPPLSPSKRSPTSPSKSYPSQPVLNLTLPAGRSQTTKQGLMKTPEATGVDDVSGGPVNTSAEKDETPPGSTTKFTPSDQVDTDNQEENIRSSYAPADGDGRDGSRVQGSQVRMKVHRYTLVAD